MNQPEAPKKRFATVTAFRALVPALVALGTVLGPATAGPAGAAPGPLTWAPCRTLVDDWNAKDARSECTQVAVPLDYSRPRGRTIKLMVSRIRAVSPKKRQGAVLINPGGPGEPGLAWPRLLSTGTVAGIGIDHDLVGFDPRGIGRSGAVACTATPADGPTPAPADRPATYRNEASYRLIYERQARYNRRCVGHNRALIASMSTTVMAHDLDRIRVALGEQKISYYGISWGTALGAEYRSLYDNNVDRMLLDSVMPPDPQVRTLYDGMIGALRLKYDGFTDWVAARDSRYHLGTTSAAITGTVNTLLRTLDADPRAFVRPDTTSVSFTGDSLRSILFAPERDTWPDAAASVAALRDGGTPPLLPEDTDDAEDADEFTNTELAQVAVTCNDQGAAPPLPVLWHHIKEAQAADPLYGGQANFEHWCAGWPLPAQNRHLQAGTSRLQLVGHRYEDTTPLGFAQAMQRRIGGALLTVEDDQHGSLDRIACGSKAVRFFRTGRTDTGTCPGVPGREGLS